MGFFQSPLKLLNILTNQSAIAESEAKPSAWYTSEEGKQAYLNADTLPKKTFFFYEYLLSIARYKGNKGVLYKIAFVMADSMVNSELEFAGYPNVIDPAKNPLVAYVKSGVIPENTGESDFTLIICSQLLCALHGEKYPRNYLLPSRKPYTRLTKQNPDGSFPDMYKIERELIWSLCTDTRDKLDIGPFIYEIGGGEDDDSEDKVEGYFAEEGK